MYTSDSDAFPEVQILTSECLLDIFKYELSMVCSKITISSTTLICNRHLKSKYSE